MCPGGALESAVRDLAETIASKSPYVVEQTKRAVLAATDEIVSTRNSHGDAAVMLGAMGDEESRRLAYEYLSGFTKAGPGNARSLAIEAAQITVREANEVYLEARKLPEVVDLQAMHAEATAALKGLKDQETKVAQLAAVAETTTDTTHEAVKARSALVTLFSLVASYTPEPRETECILCGSSTYIDPADYQIALTRGTTALTIGHLRFGEQRHLLSGLASRGARLVQPLAVHEDHVGRGIAADRVVQLGEPRTHRERRVEARESAQGPGVALE